MHAEKKRKKMVLAGFDHHPSHSRGMKNVYKPDALTIAPARFTPMTYLN